MQVALVGGVLFGLAALLTGCDTGASGQSGRSFWGGCSHPGSGSMTTISENVSDYRQISIADDIGAEVTTGSIPGISISLYENVAGYLDVHVDSGTLLLKFKDNSGVCNSGTKAVITVAEPLHAVTYGSSASASIDMLRGDSVSVRAAGSGGLTVASATATQSVDVSASGSGSVTTGVLDSASISIGSTGSGSLLVSSGVASRSVEVASSGSGSVELGSLRTPTATIRSSGSGSLSGMTSEALSIQSSGSGSIRTTATDTAGGSCSGSGSVSVAGSPALSGDCFARRLQIV